MTHYHVGHNLSGYMPEADVWRYDELEDAREGLASEMRAYADADDDAARCYLDETAVLEDYTRDEAGNIDYGDDAPSMLATVEAMLRDDPPHSWGEAGYLVEDSRGRMISFWLSSCDEACPADD